jgi:hypothetical protein
MLDIWTLREHLPSGRFTAFKEQHRRGVMEAIWSFITWRWSLI